MAVGPTLAQDLKEIKDIIAAGFDATDAAVKAGDSGTVKAGSVTAVAGDDTAGLIDIETGLSTITSFSIQILRADVLITSDQKYIDEGSGTLRVADGSTYAVTADDVINWIAVGAL